MSSNAREIRIVPDTFFKPDERFQQALQVTLPILVVEEAGQTIVATLHDVLGNAGEIGAR